MKKIILLMIGALLLTGCNEGTKLDLNKVKTDLANLTYEKDSKQVKMFDTNYIDGETLKEKYGFEDKNVDEFIVCMSKMANTSSMYAIFKIKNEDAKAEIKNFIDKYKASWEMGYFPEEEALVKDIKEENYGKYVIYVISHDNNKVIDTIKKG